MGAGHDAGDVWILAAAAARDGFVVAGDFPAGGLFLLPLLPCPFACALLLADFRMICQLWSLPLPPGLLAAGREL